MTMRAVKVWRQARCARCTSIAKRRSRPPITMQRRPVARSAVACAPVDPALISFAFGLGILPEPVSLNVIAVSIPVPTDHTTAIHRSRSLDPPPPRA